MTENERGYRLPSGDAFTEDMECMLVWYPDKKEYRQALIGSLLYLSTWLAWERDSSKRGKDAAAAWRLAVDCTLECLFMGCLDELLAEMTAIRELLQNQDACCDENITYNETTIYSTTIVVDVGDPPDYYGETAVTDWDDWKEYLCYNAHLWLDELIETSGTVETALTYGAMTIGLLAAAIIGVSFFVVGGVVSMPFLYAAVAGLVGGIVAGMFDDAADDLETAREDIVCAIMLGTSISDAVEAALSSSAAWDMFYSLIDYDSVQAILYEGGDGETYLEAEQRDDCVCYGPPFDGDIYAISLVGTGYIDGTARRLLLRSDDPNDTWWKGGGSIRIDPFTAPFEWAVGDADAEAGLPPGVDWTTYGIANFTPANNVISLRAQKLQSHSYGVGCSISMVKAWVSEDAGVTGTWHSCQLTLVSAEEWWTVDEENDTVAFSAPAGGGTWNKNVYFSVLMNAAPL